MSSVDLSNTFPVSASGIMARPGPPAFMHATMSTGGVNTDSTV